jgi:hypothetical protein
VGTSFVEYNGRGFWTRDAALETVLGLLVEQLHPLAGSHEQLGPVLDYWALQAAAGFNGCVSPALDEKLASPELRSMVTVALGDILAGLPPGGLVESGGPGFRQRAGQACAGAAWRCPCALAEWVREVALAATDLLENDLPAAVAGRWFVDGGGRHLLQRRSGHLGA